MEKKTYIDIFDGTIYGFPKEIPPEVENVQDWLLQNGCPEFLIHTPMFYYNIYEQEPPPTSEDNDPRVETIQGMLRSEVIVQK